MKKIIALILATLALTVVLASCTDDKGTASSKAPTTSTTSKDSSSKAPTSSTASKDSSSTASKDASSTASKDASSTASSKAA
ncbi:MAG: hypothetical protein RR246_01695 [Clostridia bacterium]